MFSAIWSVIFPLILASLFTSSDAKSQGRPFLPQAVPLAVVHPYLSTWLLNGTNELGGNWPQFAVDGVSRLRLL